MFLIGGLFGLDHSADTQGVLNMVSGGLLQGQLRLGRHVKSW
jgi:hypothetical protein